PPIGSRFLQPLSGPQCRRRLTFYNKPPSYWNVLQEEYALSKGPSDREKFLKLPVGKTIGFRKGDIKRSLATLRPRPDPDAGWRRSMPESSPSCHRKHATFRSLVLNAKSRCL